MRIKLQSSLRAIQHLARCYFKDTDMRSLAPLLYLLLTALFVASVSTPSMAQELLPPIAQSISLDEAPFFPYVRQLRRVCQKDPQQSFCERVAVYDSTLTVRNNYCSAEGLKDERCKEWLQYRTCIDTKWRSKECARLKSQRQREREKFVAQCKKDLNQPYCEGVAYREAKKAKKHKGKDDKKHR
jgi:hypothetical protein